MHRQCIKKCTRNAPLECRGAGVHSVCGQRASDCAVNLSKQTAFRARKSPPACIDCAQTASENARKGSQNYGQNAPSARRTGVMPAVDLHATVESLLPPGQAGWRAGAGVLCLCSWPVVIPPGRARRKSVGMRVTSALVVAGLPDRNQQQQATSHRSGSKSALRPACPGGSTTGELRIGPDRSQLSARLARVEA